MRQSFSVLVCVLLATAAYAQDVDFGAFADPGSLLGPAGSPAPAAARGTAPARGAAPTAPRLDRLVRLRDVLAKAEAPLAKEQETELNKLLDEAIPAMQRTIQTHGREMMAAKAASAPAPAATALPPGAPASSRVPPEILDALEVEMRQLNDALFTRIASSSVLNAKQQSILTKMSRDQIRARGGFEALKIAMEDAGAPFTGEQVPKVQALFEDQKTARANLARESQGTPDPAALKQLERDTLTKVVGLLIPAQRTALLGFLRSQQ